MAATSTRGVCRILMLPALHPSRNAGSRRAVVATIKQGWPSHHDGVPIAPAYLYLDGDLHGFGGALQGLGGALHGLGGALQGLGGALHGFGGAASLETVGLICSVNMYKSPRA